MTTTTVSTNNRDYSVKFDEDDPSLLQLNGKEVEIDFVREKEGSFHLIIGHKSYNVEVNSIDHLLKEVSVTINNEPYTFQIKDKYDLLLEKMGMSGLQAAKITDLKAPMPGLVLDVVASGGQEVKKGDPLLILEAMKMENVLKSPTDGIVGEIAVNQGETVEKNQLLLNFQ